MIKKGELVERMSQVNSNTLLILCDQLRLDVLARYGGNLVQTPNIEQIARDSIVFDRCYTPTALCSPARSSLMTGLYPHAHHMFNNSTPGYSYCERLRPDLRLLPQWISENSQHETAYFGKWHIGPDESLKDAGFDHHAAFSYSGTRLRPIKESLAGGKAGTLDVPFEAFPDVQVARHCEEFLRTRDRSQPFTLFCAFPGPHSPWLIPSEFGLKYRPDEIPLWPNRHDTFQGKPLYQKKLRLIDKIFNGPDESLRDDQLREMLVGCFSYIELIDHLIGDLVTTLKHTGDFDNTTIILTADHGDMAGSHGFLSKGAYMYDEIYRIPLFVKPSWDENPRRVAQPVNLMDITATLMHLAVGKEVDHMDTHQLHGQSILPLINGDASWYKQVHYAEYHGDWFGHYSSRMVTDGRWKLVWNFTDLCELYCLDEDPFELTNLFYLEEYRHVRDRYFSILKEEASRFNDGQMRLLDPAIEKEVLI